MKTCYKEYQNFSQRWSMLICI